MRAISVTRVACSVLAILCWSEAATEQPGGGENPIIAVFDLEDKGSGLSADRLSDLTDYLAARLAECGFQVVPRAQIRERLLEAKKESYKACYDAACQIELGRELAAQKSVSSQLRKFGASCQVSSVLYDLKKAVSERSANAEADCSEAALLEATKKISAGLCETLPEALRPPTRARFQGTLAIRTDPAGARITARPLAGGGEAEVKEIELGAAPLSAPLPPGKYQLFASAGGRRPQSSEIEISAGKRIELSLELESYPMNPWKRWGHVAFWTGLGLSALGGVMGYLAKGAGDDYLHGDEGAKSRSLRYEGLMWGGLGVGTGAIVTGVILWALSPGDQAWFEKEKSAPVVPSVSPAGFGLGGRF